MSTFNLQGKVIDKATKLRVPFAQVKAFEVDALPGGGFQCDLIGETLTDINGQFSITFSWSYDISINSNRPDIIFKVFQKIDGADKPIYDENPAIKTRWNIANILSDTLEASNCNAILPPASGRPYDILFVFTRVGTIGVNQINTVGPGATGYAYPTPGSTSDGANAPFGATLDIAGWFGQFTDVVRYKVQYSTNGATFHDISDPLSNSYFEFSPTGGNWITMAMGPFTEGGQTNIYKLPYLEQPGRPWIFPDLLAKWDTTKRTDGIHTLRIQGFRMIGSDLVPALSLLIDPSYGALKLNIDNSPCVAKINKIELDTTEIKVCKIAEFYSGTLKVSIEASDSKGHLAGYNLAAMYGHNQSVSPVPAPGHDSYSHHTGSLLWSGGPVIVPYPATTYDKVKMPSCAYQFRLNASKRTTNGYGQLYFAEDTWHITILREPLP
jgi:hypothetical protein